MGYILLIGSIFNIIGGVSLLLSGFVKFPNAFSEIPDVDDIRPADYMQYRLFTAGAAFTFGMMYYYLYRNPEYAMPFLLFGMALKYWAFLISAFAHYRYKLPLNALITFGFSNLFVAILFSIYLLQ